MKLKKINYTKDKKMVIKIMRIKFKITNKLEGN